MFPFVTYLYHYINTLVYYASTILTFIFPYFSWQNIDSNSSYSILILQSSPYWFTAPCRGLCDLLWFVISYCIPHIFYIYYLMVILVLKSTTLKKSRIPLTKENYSPHGDREQGQGSSSQKEPLGCHYPALCVYQLTNWKGRRLGHFAVQVAEYVHSCMRGGFSLFGRCHFRAQKSLDFQGPPPPMALEMDVKIITSHTI